MFLVSGYNACNLLDCIVKEDMRLAGLSTNWDKSDNELLHECLHLGFVVDHAQGFFKVPSTRWESLQDDANDIIGATSVR
jgi:hypothetical protein